MRHPTLPGTVGQLANYLRWNGQRKQSYLIEFVVTAYPRHRTIQSCHANCSTSLSMLVQHRQQWYLLLNGQCFGAGTRIEFAPSESTATV